MKKTLVIITLSLTLLSTISFPVLAFDESLNQSYSKIIQTSTKVSKVILNKKSLSLDIGFSETLIPTVSPTAAINQNVTWKSSKTSIATVDSEGLITAVKAGKTTITVTTIDGKKTATCSVTVMSDTPSSLVAEMTRHTRVIAKLDADFNKTKGIIEGQIQEIRKQYSTVYSGTEQQYSAELTKLQTDAQLIQNRINALALDNSSDGKARKEELQKQLNALNVRIKALQDSHTAKIRINNLENTILELKTEYDQKTNEENTLHQRNLSKF